ncbi:MAG: ferric reductase-like transmembrane domain-containing protein [Rhizobiaceae bacterium]
MQLPKLFSSKFLLWALLAFPAWPFVSEIVTPDRYYPEMMQRSGLWSIQLLVFTLAITPVSKVLRPWSSSRPFGLWLLRNRRYFGLASAFYALIHTLLYLRQVSYDWKLVWLEGLEWPFATGWISLLMLVIVASVSNDTAIKKLGKHWKNLQRLSYLAVGLGFLHWILLDFFIHDPIQWIIPLLVLKCLQFTFRYKVFNKSNKSSI